ncbi:MAG TPA: hypothetical protein VN694_12465 [Caulobacteraceae bacterium]|nr:hypothetical protein [Caulobacteraceae bacterium]
MERLKTIGTVLLVIVCGLVALFSWSADDDKNTKLTEAHDLAEQNDQAITDLTKRVDDLENEVNALQARRLPDSE